MEFVQIKCKVPGKSSCIQLCKPFFEIWSDAQEHLENVLVSIWATWTMSMTMSMNFEEKHVLKNQTRSQNSAYTMVHRKELDFPHILHFI